LDIIKSSYYYHSRNGTLTIREKQEEEEKLRQKILKIIETHPAYGYRRLIPELKKKGVIINHKRLLTLLKTWGISLKRKIVKKTKSGIESILTYLDSRVNAVKRLPEEELKKVGRVVYTDFTEIVYLSGKAKVYLIPYLEHVSKKIVGYTITNHPTTKAVLIALNEAIKTLKSLGVDLTKTYFHQDQGSVFKSYEYVGTIVKKLKALISFSRVASPEDNSEIESFFGRLKDEWKKTFYQARTKEEIFQLISEAIFYYNAKRIHSNHKDKSPDQFLKQLLKI
jgi:transposase InsO family protein